MKSLSPVLHATLFAFLFLLFSPDIHAQTPEEIKQGLEKEIQDLEQQQNVLKDSLQALQSNAGDPAQIQQLTARVEELGQQMTEKKSELEQLAESQPSNPNNQQFEDLKKQKEALDAQLKAKEAEIEKLANDSKQAEELKKQLEKLKEQNT